MRTYCAIITVLIIGFLNQSSGYSQEKIEKKGKMGKSHLEENEAACRKVYEFFNSNNWDSLANYIPENYVDHDPEPDQKPGFQGLKEFFRQYYAAFPDMKITVKNMVAEGDMVVIYTEVTGTQKGEYMGMPASGKQFDVEEIDMVHIKDGKGIERWGIFDAAKMMMQLGMMPPPPAADKK